MKNQIITKNFLSKIIFTIINIGLGFLVTPILIKFLGKEEFSLYKLTFDWLSSIGFVEQVITSSALAIIANANIGNRDQYTSKAFKKFFTFSLFFIFLAIIITPLLPYFYQITENKKLDVQISFIIGSLSFIFIPTTVFRIWIEFKEKSYLLNRFRIIQNIITAILSIALAWLTYGIIGQFIALFFGQFFFSAFLFYYFTKNRTKEQSIVQNDTNSPEFNLQFKNSNKDSLLLSLSSKLSFFSDTLILGFFVSPVQILGFSLTQKLPQMILENVQSLGNSAWASLIDIHRNDGVTKFQEKLLSLTRVTIFLTISLCLPLLFLNKSFIRIWVGEEHFMGFALTAIAILNVYFMSIFSLWGWCLSGDGKIKIQIPIYFYNALVNIISSLILIQFFGILGPVLGTLIGFITVYLYMIPKSLQKVFQISTKQLKIEILTPLIILLVLIPIANVWELPFVISNIMLWLCVYGVLFSITVILLYFFFLKKSEKDFVKDIVLKKFNFNKT